MNRLTRWLVDVLPKQPTQYVYAPPPDTGFRAMVGQREESAHWMYAPNPLAARLLPYFALSVWVHTAVSRLSEHAAMAELEIVDAEDVTRQYPEHGLLRLLGRTNGRPNDTQDSYEFFEKHFIYLDLAGNCYWYWFAEFGGAPNQVWLLDPALVEIRPGRAQTVGEYIYKIEGREYHLAPESVTHYRRGLNPSSRYYGLSALDALSVEVQSDRSMAEWNRDFFSGDVSLPAGMLIVPASVSDRDRDRISDELNAKHGGGHRSTAVVRADPGMAVWNHSGLGPHEMDFENGRLLSRKAVYEAIGLPLGLMSESSTEAHARVAERRLVDAIEVRHVRTTSRINIDAMQFWPGWRKRRARFEDLRAKVADWEQEKKKLEAVAPYMTVNEVRTRHLNLPPREDGERYGNEGRNTGADSGATERERAATASRRLAAPGGGGDEEEGAAREEGQAAAG